MSEAQNNQPILDHEGNDLHQEAEAIYSSHESAVGDQHYAESHRMVIQQAREVVQTLGSMDEQDPDVRLAATTIKASLNERLDEATKYHVDDDINAIQESVDEAREHYELNREGYEQAAIQDATAAGHDINFGGKQFPVQ